ncbi:MAG: hypothetical protein ACE5OZ_09930 [Candidatus Heimdallarchaeota archaeon]
MVNYPRKLSGSVFAVCYLLWAKRITILRGAGTIMGAGLFLAAFLLRAIDQDATAFEPLLAIPGLIFLYFSWYYQVNRRIKTSIIGIGGRRD